MEEKKISVYEIIGSKAADDTDKGDKVFDEIKKYAKNEGDKIILDFESIELVNTAFFNNAIGRVFDSNVFDISKNSVKIANIEPAMLDLLKEAISTARERYKN